MKSNLIICFILALLASSLSSCESMFDNIFDRHPDYDYLIHNGGTDTIYVAIEPKASPSTIIHGIPPRYTYAIAPGAIKEVWSTSGLVDGLVFDEEKGNTELYWFKVVSAVREDVATRKFLNDTGRWIYKKEKNYKATYTLTLTDSDF